MDDELDIAIVGMSGRFPGARNLDEFWRNLAAGVESITRLADAELLESGVPAVCLENPAYVKAAPVLDEPGGFDAPFFGFSPMEARTMDPQHRILLELAHEALEHAGCDPDRYAGRIGVFTGSALNTYFMNVGLASRFAEEYIPTLIGNDKDFLSTRISYKLNLKGPSITVQSACSTSLVAVHLARQSLLTRETDMALAGAVSVRVPHRAGYFCDGGGVVSPDGCVRAFDAKANGTVFGSGGGVVVLKRLSDAIADGDTIHAVIKGSAVNNDGSEKAGYTAPGVASQADAVVEALANAGVDADSVSYVEAHGSGTPVGDPIEMRALTRAFRGSTQRSGYCAIGSVKTNIGHLDAAAAIAGLIKTVLALERRILPPSLHFNEPNPEIDFAATPFYVNARLQDWQCEGPRRAGVMSTGMGGTNAHVVLEEAPPAPAAIADRPPHLLILSARSPAALDAATHRLREFLGANIAVNLADAAYTLQCGRKAFEERRCLVCTGREDAIDALGEQQPQRALSGHANDARRPVILLLPGIGDHYVGMGSGLYDDWPVFKAEVDRCAGILEPELGFDIRSILYPDGGGWRKARENRGGIDLRKMLGRGADAPEDEETRSLNRTLHAQPALFTIEYALARLWESLGVKPDAIIGHSMGEYVAACLAGVLSLEDALRLVALRAKLVSELAPGAMLAVTLPEDELLSVLPGELSISLINGPRLCVVAGPDDAVAGFANTLQAKSVICRRVQNAHAFHSSMLDPIAKAFENEVRKVRLNPPLLPYISNVTGTWITHSEAVDPAYWARHATRAARFNDALRELWRFKDAVLLEAGPGRTLGVLAMQHPDRKDGGDPVAVPSLRHDYENRPDVEFLLESIGRLWLSGSAVKWESLPCDRPRRRIALPTYPFERQQHWLAPVRVAEAAPQQRMIRKNPDPAQWLYVPSWKRLPPKIIGAQEIAAHLTPGGRWLVFADQIGFAATLIARLESAGQEVVAVEAGARWGQADRSVTIDPANSGHYHSLIHALRANGSLPDRIVHAWSLTGDAPAHAEPDCFTQAQDLGFYSLVFLASALAAHSVGHEIELTVLSNNVQEVCGTEPLQPEKSTLLGPCMAIRQEYPNIRTRHIDLDLSGPRVEHGAAADRVFGELLDSGSSPFVAHRNSQRWLQTYERLIPDAPRGIAATLRKGGVYLITGGLGRIGTAISQYLAQSYGARLVLAGRSSLPERDARNGWVRDHPADDPVSARIRAIEAIEKLGGEVLYVKADVSDACAMRACVDQAHRRFGALHGVIHGAGIVSVDAFSEIKDSDRDSCERHFQPKARGARILEEVLDGEPLDFCLLCSSLTSVLGGIGHAAYASANLYLDALVRRHNRSSTVPWLSLSWDIWRLDDSAALGSGFGTTLKELGMSAAEATRTLETALALKAAGHLLVSTGDLGARIDQWIRLQSLDSGGSANSPIRPGPAASASGPHAGDEEPRDETEQKIVRIWRDALGIERIGRDDSFARLGGHSLLAVRIVAELRKAFQIDLPVRVLFEAPTVAELSRYVKERIVAEIEALTEEEAQRLVASG